MFPKTSRFNKQESHKGSGPSLKQKFPGSPYGKAGLNPCKPKPPIGPKGSCEQTSLIFNSPSSRLSENTFRLKKNHENYGRHSMEPPRGGASRTPKLFKSSTEQLSKQKSQSVGKARKSLPYKNDLETTASPQTSCIPRLKKKLTESVKILKMTREKVSNLLAELKTTLLTANEDIEVACNEAVKNLILQLKKPALEPSVL
ncbi:hypothetical protein HUJ04_013232 [Dendroctonus ponderosae]|nr:hypothetical protein HUJ04_013232 [Dendroctonus ponderosae]